MRGFMRRDAVINLRVPGELKSALLIASAAESRTLAGMVMKILEDWVGDRERRRRELLAPVDRGF